MIYEIDAKPFVDAGKDMESISIYLSSLCNGSVQVEVIRDAAALLGVVDGDSGDLIDLLDAVNEANPLKSFARFFKQYVFNAIKGDKVVTLDGSKSDVPGVDTFDSVIGFGLLSTMLAAIGLQTDPVDDRVERLRLAIIEAAGGLKFPPPEGSAYGTRGVTVADIQAAKDAYEQEEAGRKNRLALDQSIATAENDIINPAKADNGRTVATIAAAFRSAADALEA